MFTLPILWTLHFQNFKKNLKIVWMFWKIFSNIYYHSSTNFPNKIYSQFPARSVANVQAAIEHIYPLVYEFKKARTPKDEAEPLEEEFLIEEDDDSDFGYDPDPIDEVDPLEEPPNKKQKVRDISHLTKRFKGSRAAKRPPGKMNDPSEDLICVSDCDDPDDF